MKTKYKIGYKHIMIVIIITFGLLTIVSSVSATYVGFDDVYQMPIDFDDGHKIFKIGGKKFNSSWNAYRYSEGENDAIIVDRYYKLKNKRGKITFNENTHYTIEKVKKNRIKVTVSYSVGPNVDIVKIYKTKLSVRVFYWRYIETQFTGKFDQRIFSKGLVIDNGNLRITIPYNGSSGSNITTADHSINWKAKTYTKFPKIVGIELEDIVVPIYPKFDLPTQSNHSRYTISGFNPSVYKAYDITIVKTSENKIKITVKNIRRINANLSKDKIYYVKTNLSAKKYYFEAFKSKMTEIFSVY